MRLSPVLEHAVTWLKHVSQDDDCSHRILAAALAETANSEACSDEQNSENDRQCEVEPSEGKRAATLLHLALNAARDAGISVVRRPATSQSHLYDNERSQHDSKPNSD